MKNIKEYDVLRVVVTILVIVGHSIVIRSINSYGGCDYTFSYDTATSLMNIFLLLHGLIYTFHMPLFMALSGALFYKSMCNGKYTSLILLMKDKFKRLIIPFFIVSIGYVGPLKYLSGYFSESTNVLKDFLVGQILVQGNTHLWFLEALFFIFIIIYVLERNIKVNIMIKLIFLLFIMEFSSIIDINAIKYPLQYAFWFYLGYRFEPIREKINSYLKFTHIVVFACAFLLLFSLNSYTYGLNNILLKILSHIFKVVIIILGCAMTYCFSFNLSKSKIINNKIFQVINKNSFEIYLYSDTLNYVILSIMFNIFGNYIFTSAVGYTMLFITRFMISTCIAIIISVILRKLKIKNSFFRGNIIWSIQENKNL